MDRSEPPRPWHTLPSSVAVALRPELPELAGETIAALRADVPAYAKPLEGSFGRGIRNGVQEALGLFVAEIEAGGRVPRADVYRELGRGEMRAGRSLNALLSAYRLGARVAWRRFAAAGQRAALEPEVLYRLAEALFAYIDELSAESAEGYALEQSAAAGAASLRRRRLLRLLVGEQPADATAVEAAAEAAGWPLPRTLAALAIGGARREQALGRMPVDVLAEPVEDVVCALVPDPDAPGRRAVLERAVPDGALGGLGPSVAWADAPVSFARARAVLGLAQAGRLPPTDGEGRLVTAAAHASSLLLSGDRRLARDLAAERLAPLHALGPVARERLTETLDAWLAEQGRLQPAAARLGVHPQTVRYRLARLRERLGGALDDPQGRFELEVALRAQRLLQS